MLQADEYEVHMLSFKRVGTNACNIAFGNGGNLQPWHLDALEKWLAKQRAKSDDGSDMV